MSVDGGRGELAQTKEVHKITLPRFNEGVCKEAVLTEGEEVLTPRRISKVLKNSKGMRRRSRKKNGNLPRWRRLGSIVSGTASVTQKERVDRYAREAKRSLPTY